MIRERRLHLNVIPVFVVLCAQLLTTDTHKIYESKSGEEIVELYKTNLRRMIKMMDQGVEACNNFFEHACANYGQGEESPSAPPFLYNSEDQMHFFEQHRQEFRTPVGLALRQLYDECKERKVYHVWKPRSQDERWQRMTREIYFLRRHHRILHNHWPFLRFQWKQYLRHHYTLDWIELAARFAAHGVPIFFNIFFAEQTVFIAPMAEDLECNGIEESFLPILQRRNPQIGTIIANELSAFCRQLNEKPLEEQGTHKSQTAEEIDTTRFHNITSTYFSVFFSSLNLTESEVETARHITLHLPRLQKVFQLLQDTEQRVIYNFILWYAYRNLAYEDCFQLTLEWREFVIAEYWDWSVFEAYFQRDVALALYVFQTTRFQRYRKTMYLRTDWDRLFHGKSERPDFSIERIMKGHANAYLSAELLTENFGLENRTLRAGSFYANVLKLRRLRLRNSFHHITADFDDTNEGFYYLREFLNFCILFLNRPMFHYFVTQDFDLWHASHLLESTDGYYTSLDCLEHQTLAQKPDESEEGITLSPAGQEPLFAFLSPWQTLELFNFYNAFIAAYEDYRFWLSAESFAFAEEFVLEYFGLDSQKILFYAAAQLYCGRNDHLFSAMINRSFMNMFAFQTAFNCSTEAPMNPAQKCMSRQCNDKT